MKKKGWTAILLVLLLLVGITGCGSAQESSEDSQAVNYDKESHWLSVPDKIKKPVDVFYVYPTVWHKEKEDEPNICDIDNKTMLEGAPVAYETQATAFEAAGNIFAPYYRQADAAYCLSVSDKEQDEILSGIPKTDLYAALDYYFENYNEGRPFILAGHSQGSNMLLFVLSEYMKEHPEYYERMVAAYVIGYSVTEDFLEDNSHLKFAQGDNDTGVIISYNTEAPKIEGENPVLLEGAKAINPITWTLDVDKASARESKGSRIDGKKVKSFADATVNLKRGAVICSTADKEQYSAASPIFGKGVFHGQDYPFYYYDIQENAKLRVKTYLKGQN